MGAVNSYHRRYATFYERWRSSYWSFLVGGNEITRAGSLMLVGIFLKILAPRSQLRDHLVFNPLLCHFVRCMGLGRCWVETYILYIYIYIYIFIFFLWRCGPTRAMASSFLKFLDHTQRRITVDRTPLDEWSARRRDLYITTRNTYNKKTSVPPVGFEPTISAGERP